MKRQFTGEFEAFYDQCLKELKSRSDYTDAYLPMLDRYVLISMKAANLGAQIVDDEVTVEHTNKAEKTNTVTSPAWRMFVLLDTQANKLAKELKLSPISAPANSGKKKEKREFNLGGKMKVA